MTLPRTPESLSVDDPPLEEEPPIWTPGRRLERLLEVARSKRQGLILTHDNPDPDALAAGFALGFLLESRAGVPTRVAYGGIVGRAENLAMLELLKLDALPVARIDFNNYDLLGLVDTQPASGNHSLPRDRLADIVVDHHPVRPGTDRVPFADLGRGLGSTSTLLVELLREAELEPPVPLSTALFYGVKADTRDLTRQSERLDLDAYHWLLPRIDRKLLARIEHPTLTAAYFALYHEALERARIHGDTLVVALDEVYAPDAIPELGERLFALKGLRRSLALGVWNGDLYVSVRTDDPECDLGKLTRQLCRDLGGTAGGHPTMAGACIPLRTSRGHLVHRLVDRFLDAFGIEDKRGEPLLVRRERVVQRIAR